MGSPDQSRGTLTVVCVDDDRTTLELLRHAVEDQPDFEIAAAATDGQSFQVLVMKHRPDVVIVDHMLRDPMVEQAGRFGRVPRLPQPSGLELIERTRTLVPEATIVLFTAKAGLDVASHNSGVDLYIEKPHVDKLWPAIRQVRAQR